MFSAILLFGVVATSALAADEGACVITDTECPCAVKTSSGSCMRHQGDNLCLLGDCNNGYKCDCLAYEYCSISKCSIFTTGANAIPSLDTPFQCHLTADAGTCTVFSHFMNSVNAADNAKADASATVAETNKAMQESADDVAVMQAGKIAVDAVVEELDGFPEEVTEEERADVEKDVEDVVSKINEAQAETNELQQDMAEAANANFQVGFFRNVCRVKENAAKGKEAEEKEEAKKPENGVVCNRCEVLKEEVKQLRKERRDAAKLAGTWAKKAQAAKDRCRRRRKNVKKTRVSAEKARARCITRAEKILARLRGRAGPKKVL